MRVIVDRTLCEGNALCAGRAPTVFDLGDDDQLTVLQERPGEELRPQVLAAVAACPRRALTLVDD